MTYSLITLLIITEYSDSARVWKVGGVWYTTQRAELTERMKKLYLQEMTHLRQQLRETTRQKDAVIQRNEQELERNTKTIQQKDQALQQKEATIHQFQSDIREKDLQIQQKNDVIQRHEGTITQQQGVITSYRDNPSRLIEGDVTGEESKEAMLIQLNQSRELAEGVTVILV